MKCRICICLHVCVCRLYEDSEVRLQQYKQLSNKQHYSTSGFATHLEHTRAKSPTKELGTNLTHCCTLQALSFYCGTVNLSAIFSFMSNLN